LDLMLLFLFSVNKLRVYNKILQRNEELIKQ
jgi:hypothetical protein